MKVEKKSIIAMPRKLSANWTVALEETEIEFGEDILDSVATIMQEEIDWEVMCDLLKESGWIGVTLSTEQVYIEEWARDNCKGKYKSRYKKWLFESEKDAALFILRWS